MEFHWVIVSRTGDRFEGEDSFPSQEQKNSANLFELFLPFDCSIEAPYGQSFKGSEIKLTVPDDHILVFKKRVQFNVDEGMSEIGARSYKFIIAFEKV